MNNELTQELNEVINLIEEKKYLLEQLDSTQQMLLAAKHELAEAQSQEQTPQSDELSNVEEMLKIESRIKIFTKDLADIEQRLEQAEGADIRYLELLQKKVDIMRKTSDEAVAQLQAFEQVSKEIEGQVELLEQVAQKGLTLLKEIESFLQHNSSPELSAKVLHANSNFAVIHDKLSCFLTGLKEVNQKLRIAIETALYEKSAQIIAEMPSQGHLKDQVLADIYLFLWNLLEQIQSTREEIAEHEQRLIVQKMELELRRQTFIEEWTL